MKTIQIVFASVLLAGVMIFAFAQGHEKGAPGGPGPEGRPGMRMQGGMQGGIFADMTPELKAKVQPIISAGEKLAKPHRDKAKAIGEEIVAAFMAKKVDAKKVNALIAKEGKENVAARQAMTASLIKVKPMLNNEQYKRIINPRPMMGMRRGMGGQPMPSMKPPVKTIKKPVSKPVKK